MSTEERCSRCERGQEACGYCHGLPRIDWETVCDCGLYDFGAHLLDCEARAGFVYVIARDYAEAELRL